MLQQFQLVLAGWCACCVILTAVEGQYILCGLSVIGVAVNLHWGLA